MPQPTTATIISPLLSACRRGYVKLLGVVIDDKLNFTSHTPKLIKKVGKQIDVLNRFKHITKFSIFFHIFYLYIYFFEIS